MNHKPHEFTRHKFKKGSEQLDGKLNEESVLHHKHLTILKTHESVGLFN